MANSVRKGGEVGWVNRVRTFRYSLVLPLLLLSGCSNDQVWLLNPKGLISATELHFTIMDVLVMLGIVVPTAMAMVWFLWRYRRSSGKAKYDPSWSRSKLIEFIVWGIPLAMVGFLGYLSYKSTFETNPYGPTALARTNSTQVSAPPLNVDVITTDWRWLFIYPQQHVASVDELVVPVHRRVRFRLTSTTVDNGFFIPQLVGQVNVMPGMRTKQEMQVDVPGSYQGFSTEYSGPGFSWMQFQARAVSGTQFQQWIQQAQRSPRHLAYADFERFAQPTINLKKQSEFFSGVGQDLFDQVIHEAMLGKTYPTPMAMTENMSKLARVSR